MAGRHLHGADSDAELADWASRVLPAGGRVVYLADGAAGRAIIAVRFPCRSGPCDPRLAALYAKPPTATK